MSYAKTIQNIINHYSRLFNIDTEEDDEEGTESTEEGSNQTEDSGSGNPIAKYGVLTYIIELVPMLGISFYEILDLPITEIFNLTTYKMDYNLNKELMLKDWKAKH